MYNLLNNSSNIKKSLNEIIPYGIEFYGDEYKYLLYKLITHSYFYEWTDENLSNIYSKLTKIYNSEILSDLDKNQDFIDGMYLSNSKQAFIIVKSKYDKDLFSANLAHEFLGHGMCGLENAIIFKGDNVYKRNGITYADLKTGERFDVLANEGFIEGIALDIMNLKIKDFYKKNPSYVNGQKIYNAVKECYGKDEIIKLMVYGKKNIKDFYNVNTKLDEWDIITNNIKNEKLVNENVKSFVKRFNQTIN